MTTMTIKNRLLTYSTILLLVLLLSSCTATTNMVNEIRCGFGKNYACGMSTSYQLVCGCMDREIVNPPKQFSCEDYATKEVERIVPTKPHELRCSGGGAEADYIQHQVWAYNSAYSKCIEGLAK